MKDDTLNSDGSYTNKNSDHNWRINKSLCKRHIIYSTSPTIYLLRHPVSDKRERHSSLITFSEAIEVDYFIFQNPFFEHLLG